MKHGITIFLAAFFAELGYSLCGFLIRDSNNKDNWFCLSSCSHKISRIAFEISSLRPFRYLSFVRVGGYPPEVLPGLC